MLTTESTTWEGIFRVFSSQLEVTLEQAHLVDPKDPSKITDVKEVIVFPFEKVVLLTAANHDLTFAAKGKTPLTNRLSTTFHSTQKFHLQRVSKRTHRSLERATEVRPSTENWKLGNPTQTL